MEKWRQEIKGETEKCKKKKKQQQKKQQEERM